MERFQPHLHGQPARDLYSDEQMADQSALWSKLSACEKGYRNLQIEAIDDLGKTLHSWANKDLKFIPVWQLTVTQRENLLAALGIARGQLRSGDRGTGKQLTDFEEKWLYSDEAAPHIPAFQRRGADPGGYHSPQLSAVHTSAAPLQSYKLIPTQICNSSSPPQHMAVPTQHFDSSGQSHVTVPTQLIASGGQSHITVPTQPIEYQLQYKPGLHGAPKFDAGIKATPAVFRHPSPSAKAGVPSPGQQGHYSRSTSPATNYGTEFGSTPGHREDTPLGFRGGSQQPESSTTGAQASKTKHDGTDAYTEWYESYSMLYHSTVNLLADFDRRQGHIGRTKMRVWQFKSDTAYQAPHRGALTELELKRLTEHLLQFHTEKWKEWAELLGLRTA